MSAEPASPSVLVLGATGTVGRNLIEFLVSRGLSSSIRASDKRMPGRAFVRSARAAFLSSYRVKLLECDGYCVNTCTILHL